MRKNITLLSHRLIRAATVTREAKKQMLSLKHHLTCKLFQVRRANHQGKQRCPYLSKSYVQVALRVRGRRINIWQNCERGGNSEGWAHWHSGCGHSSPFSVCGNFRCNIPASSVWCFQCVNSELFPMREKTTQVGQCSAGDGGGVVVVVWSLPCNSQSLSISLPQPPRSLLPAFMGSLRICGKGTLIARGLRSSENGEKEVIACPRSIHHRVKSPVLLDTIRSVEPFPFYLAISLTYGYDLDGEIPWYLYVRSTGKE